MMITQPQIEAQARALFWHLISDNADFLSAVEARAAFVKQHFYCSRCNEIKHRSLFYALAVGVRLPCRDCELTRMHLEYHRLRGERQRAAKLMAVL